MRPVEPKVRIRILSKYKLNKIEIFVKDGTLFLTGDSIRIYKKRLMITASKSRLIIEVSNRCFIDNSVRVSAVEYAKISFRAKKKYHSRRYKGSFNIKLGTEGIIIINSTLLEDYVHSAAIAELGRLLYLKGKKKRGWRHELLAAMEISTRSFILGNYNRHRNKDYQFCDLTHCVHFPGISSGMFKNNTIGKVIMSDSGNIINAYFHSTCGGVLSGPEVYWMGHKPGRFYRRGFDNDITGSRYSCSISPHYKWKYFVSKKEVMSILRVNSIINLKANKKQGRVYSIEYKTEKNYYKKIPISNFISRSGRLLGWAAIKSNYFSIQKLRHGYLFKGRGLGHGVGLCQWGAYKMAIEGRKHHEIIGFYYNEAKIIKFNDN